MTVEEKIKTMSPEEVVYFFKAVFKKESFIDDLYCEQCKAKYESCPCGDNACLSDSEDLVKWFLKQPFEKVEKKLFDGGMKHFMIL